MSRNNAGSNKSILKAQKEYDAACAEGSSDMGRFALRRLPLPTIKRIEVLPVFDHIPDDEPEAYFANEAILFGEPMPGGLKPSPEFETAVRDKNWVSAAVCLVRATRGQYQNDRPEKARNMINSNTLLDYACRNGFNKEQARALLRAHNVSRIKIKDVVFEDGRIVAINGSS